MVDWDRVRSDFPVSRDKVYLMSAAMSPMPSVVFERVVSEYRRINEAGDIFWEEDIKTCRGLRSRIGGMINASADDLAFVANTSTAMSILALSLKGDGGRDFNIVSMADEFPASTVPFEFQRLKMNYAQPTGARYPVESVLERVDKGTLAVVTSHVQYATGFRQDLERLGVELKKRGVLHIVNATQAFPIFPVDVKAMRIDAMSASLHKWGFAGHVGALFYTSPEFRARFAAPMAGWLSVAPRPGAFIHTGKNEPFELYDTADRYVQGCINFQAINTMHAALDYLESIGSENVVKKIHELNDYLIAGLWRVGACIVSPIDSIDERSAILSFNIGERTADCVAYLEAQNIFVSYRQGNIRSAVNIFNDEQDIDRLLTAIEFFGGV
ncbi:MAG: aminotransferase class V-fold PLP-dependent enzyme [bacterium]